MFRDVEKESGQNFIYSKSATMALVQCCAILLFFLVNTMSGDRDIHIHSIQPTYPDAAGLPPLEKWRELLDANRDVKAALNYRVR